MAEYIKKSIAIAIVSDSADMYPFEKNEAIRRIEDSTPADVAPVVHSRWEECDYVEPCVHGFGTIRTPNAGLKCKNCSHVFKKQLLWKENYCPNCGAEMDLKEEL